MILSPDQRSAIDAVLAWHADSSSPQTLTLGGYAGTGKTTVIRELLDVLGRYEVVVCAFTGKAAAVLRAKGVSATTMHRVIYAPELLCRNCDEVAEDEGCVKCETDEHLELQFTRVPKLEALLVIVDEASMLSRPLVEDLLSFGVKVLFVGDHGQLEPIGDDPGLMAEPDLRLEEIHRQAEGSSIIQFAHLLRKGVHPGSWIGDSQVEIRAGAQGAELSKYDIVLCGFNRTRVHVNRSIRRERGFEGDPQPGERMICLQNDADMGIFNGQLFTVTAVRGGSRDLLVLDLEDDVGERHLKTPILREQLGLEKKEGRAPRGIGLFDFGYCLTVHKSQGSEWPRVAVLDQVASAWSATRWRYTAASRASQSLHYYLPTRR